MNGAGPADRAIGIEQPGQQCATLRLRGTQIPRGDVLITEHSEAAEDARDRPIRRSTSLAHPRSGDTARKGPAAPGTGRPLPPVSRSERFAAARATARHDLRRGRDEFLATDRARPSSRSHTLPRAGESQSVLKAAL